MFDYSRWPGWAQVITALLLLLFVGFVYWFAWFRPAIRAASKFSAVSQNTIVVVFVVVAVILALGWKWVTTH